tara:strand:+ start:141 stop:353 length:213 start_codon:yes stop_codon:yes gene_type:complete
MPHAVTWQRIIGLTPGQPLLMMDMALRRTSIGLLYGADQYLHERAVLTAVAFPDQWRSAFTGKGPPYARR